MTRQTTEPLEHFSLNVTNRFIEFYVTNVEEGHILLDAPYQRGDVWTEDQRIALVCSWLRGVPVPAVIVNDRTSPWWTAKGRKLTPDDEYFYAVIDGKQRILTAVAWLAGDFAVPATWFPPEFVDTTEDTDDGPYVRFTGLTKTGQRFAESRTVLPCAEGKLATVEEEALVYLLINGGGTPQTDADMTNAAKVAGGPELTVERANGGHCTRGGTIASGQAVCQCGDWNSADYPDPASRKLARQLHLAQVYALRTSETVPIAGNR
jgi:hypothetical protein